MLRPLTVFALVIVALHLLSAATLETSTAATVVGNSLQIIACGLAVSMTVTASRRGHGLG